MDERWRRCCFILCVCLLIQGDFGFGRLSVHIWIDKADSKLATEPGS
jgi:hypothetical protein